MTKDEALKLALEALEYIYEGANNQGPHTGISWRCVSNKTAPAITALRKALAEQEPVAWRKPLTDEEVEKIIKANMNLQMNLAGIRADFEEKLQRTWVGLTDEEIQYCVELKNPEAIAEEVEVKLKEKNT